MRVTGGVAKGHLLKAVPVRELRPTQDVVRQAIFNILGKMVVERKVADLYAGTGALGIEALSRGAKSCYFVESHRGACTAIAHNLNHTRLLGKGKIICRSVLRFLEELPDKDLDLVLLDPPYTLGNIEPVIRKIIPHLSNGAIIVYEHAKTTEVPKIEGLEVFDRRIYGETKVTFLTKA